MFDIVRLIIDASDPHLCGVGSDVLCWIEPLSQGDTPPVGMTTPDYQAGAPNAAGPENGFNTVGSEGGDSSADLGWLASDGLLEGNKDDDGPGDLFENMSDSGDFVSGLYDSTPDYSTFGR